MNLEALSRCTAQAVNMSPIGGTPELTRAEIAGALKGASLGALWLVEWKYWGDDGLPRQKLERLAERLALVVALEHNWKMTDYSIPHKLAVISLHNSVNPCICHKCNQAPALKPDCKACSGLGILRPKTVWRQAGITSRSWNAKWRRRYLIIDSAIQNWVGGLDVEIRRAICYE